MLSSITSIGILAWAILAALAVASITGISAGVARLRKRRQAQRSERIRRWRNDPQATTRGIAGLSQEARERITGRLNLATTKQTQATTALEQYEGSLPTRPAWKWALLVILIPLSALLLYTQAISDIASFAAMKRAAEVALVLGIALALGLFAIPLFIRIHTDGMPNSARKVGWYMTLAFTVVLMIGIATMVAGSRGEVQYAPAIQQSIANLAWFESEGDTYAAEAEKENLAELRAQRDAVVDQDRFFAGGLSAAEAVLGWLEMDSLTGAGLLALRANRRRRDLSVVRKQAALNRFDRRVQRDIIRGATEAGVLDQLRPDGQAPPAPRPVGPGPEAGGNNAGPMTALPAASPATEPADDAPDLGGAGVDGTGPAPSTTNYDDNL